MVRRTIREAFDRLDKNKDGAITKYEFGQMLNRKKTRRQMMLMESIGGEAFDIEKDWELLCQENVELLSGPKFVKAGAKSGLAMNAYAAEGKIVRCLATRLCAAASRISACCIFLAPTKSPRPPQAQPRIWPAGAPVVPPTE